MSGIRASLLLPMLGFWPWFVLGAEQATNFSQLTWRCPANDGVNVLYCCLRIHGVSCEYSRLQALRNATVGAGPLTALSVADLSAKSGMGLTPVSLTIDQLKSCPLPLIAHLDGDSTERGAFILLMSIGSNNLDYLDGSIVMIKSMDMEKFRRKWSGVALVPVGKRRWDIGLGLAGLGAGLLVSIRLKSNRL